MTLDEKLGSSSVSERLGINFYKLLAAQFISSAGDWLYKIALPLLVFELTGSAVDMASTFALTFLPFLFFSLVGGVIADRYPRQRVLILCSSASSAILVLIAFAAESIGSMPLIYILVFLAASITPIQHPSFQAFIPEVVSGSYLARANSFVSSSENIISIAAPALSGLVVALLGPTLTIIINAVCFFLSAICIYLIRTEKIHKKETISKTLKDSINEGFKYAWSNPVLKYGSLLFIGSNFAINVFQANLVFYLANILAAPTEMIGAVFALTGMGAVIGALIAPWVMSRFEAGRIIVSCTILAGLFTFPLLWIQEPILIGVVWGLETAFGSVNVVTYFTLRQRAVPKYILGRAVALTRLISYSSIPIAAFLGGIILSMTNISVVILLCASVRLATGLLALLSPLMRYDSGSEELR